MRRESLSERPSNLGLVPVGLATASAWTGSPIWAVFAALYAIAAQPLQDFLSPIAVAAGERLADRIRGGGRSPPPPAG